MIYFILLFIAKMFDNAFGTAKTILIQRDKGILAAVSLVLSNLIYFYVTKLVVTDSTNLGIIVISVASGFGCYFAMLVGNRLSKDRTYVNIIMSDNREDMQDLRDFLAVHHITNVATDSYTKDWNKTITITAYTETKAENILIDNFIKESDKKFKRLIQKKQGEICS